MLINRFLIVLSMLLTGAGLAHAQDRSDTARLKGEWQIEKVETRLVEQQGNGVLEAKTYTSTDDMKSINAFVPLNIKFGDHDCTMVSRSGAEQGTYTLPQNGMFRYLPESLLRQLQQQLQKQGSNRELTTIAGAAYIYRLQQSFGLVLNMPAAFYKDNNRNLAVKLVYTCYYTKK